LHWAAEPEKIIIIIIISKIYEISWRTENKVVPVRVMKTYGGRGGIAPCIRNLVTRWR
jgi:hypothetical protein